MFVCLFVWLGIYICMDVCLMDRDVLLGIDVLWGLDAILECRAITCKMQRGV